MTGRDLIISTLRSIRVLGVGDNLSAEDANDALDRLNDWLDSLALERLSMYYVKSTTKLLANDVATYTIGLGGDINIARPTHIEAAAIVIDPAADPPYETPLQILTDQRWQSIRMKPLMSTYPSALYYDHNWVSGLGTIHLWPTPRECGQVRLILYTPVALLEFATLDTDYTFPPGYRRFIRANFAAEIAPEYGKSLTGDQVQIARQSKAVIKRGNVRPGELRVDRALVNGGDFFDFRTGGSW